MRSDRGGGSGRNRSDWRSDGGKSSRIIGAEAIDDATLLQVVGRHLQTHAITGENAHLIHAHAAREMTEECVILGFQRGDANAERGIGKALRHHANELDHILGHRREKGSWNEVKPWELRDFRGLGQALPP